MTSDRLIVDDPQSGIFRVNRRAFKDPELLEQEQQKIFDASWLYVGHVEEAPNPGDYVTRNVGGRPVILVCDKAGKHHVLLNSCPHRGNVVCRESSGSASQFMCFYHAWTFDLSGQLKGLPGADAYSNSFNKREMGLTPAPRMEIYRKLIFISFDPEIIDLVTYLAGARDHLDLILDSSGEEDLAPAPGQHSYSIKANWKLLVENSLDAYHGLSTHRRYFGTYLRDLGIDPKVFATWTGDDKGAGRALGNGHAVMERTGSDALLSKIAPEELHAIRNRLIAKHGEERGRLISESRRNLFIFPNLMVISTWRTIRTFYPISPDSMVVNAWSLIPRNEPATLRAARLENFVAFLGPGGFGSPDDVAVLEGCHRGFATSREQPWSDISRGMKRSAQADDELQMRAFWRRWHECMTGEPSLGQDENGSIDSKAER